MWAEGWRFRVRRARHRAARGARGGTRGDHLRQRRPSRRALRRSVAARTRERHVAARRAGTLLRPRGQQDSLLRLPHLGHGATGGPGRPGDAHLLAAGPRVLPLEHTVVTAEEIAEVAIFAGLGSAVRERLSRAAADITLQPGEYAAHEGEERA